MKIKNWSQFQHFKDRRPPWIKLYRDLLDDVEWHELDAEAAKVLVMLWLIASEHDGRIPEARILAFRLRLPEKQVKSIVSKLSHWLEQDDIEPISERYQDDLPETERETEERQRESVAIAPLAPPEKKAIEGKTGSRLAPDWQPSEEDQKFAKEQGVPWNAEAPKFRDYWTAQAGAKGRKTDWSATWRNWIRRAAEKRAGWPSLSGQPKDDKAWLLKTAPKERIKPKGLPHDDDVIEF